MPPVTSYFRKEEQFTKRLTRVEKISFFLFLIFYNNYTINFRFCQDFFSLKFIYRSVPPKGVICLFVGFLTLNLTPLL